MAFWLLLELATSGFTAMSGFAVMSGFAAICGASLSPRPCLPNPQLAIRLATSCGRGLPDLSVYAVELALLGSI